MKLKEKSAYVALAVTTMSLGWLPATRADLVWEQLPFMDGPAFNSQSGGFVVANDFQPSDREPIVAVEWCGTYWPSHEPSEFDGFWIRLFDSYPDLDNPLYEEYILPDDSNESFYGYNQVYDANVYEYHADLAVPFQPTPGQTYWLSIQMDLVPAGCEAWWGWQTSVDPYDPWGSWALQKTDTNRTGHP